jgi:hypothetical protein
MNQIFHILACSDVTCCTVDSEQGLLQVSGLHTCLSSDAHYRAVLCRLGLCLRTAAAAIFVYCCCAGACFDGRGVAALAVL